MTAPERARDWIAADQLLQRLLAKADGDPIEGEALLRAALLVGGPMPGVADGGPEWAAALDAQRAAVRRRQRDTVDPTVDVDPTSTAPLIDALADAGVVLDDAAAAALVDAVALRDAEVRARHLRTVADWLARRADGGWSGPRALAAAEGCLRDTADRYLQQSASHDLAHDDGSH